MAIKKFSHELSVAVSSLGRMTKREVLVNGRSVGFATRASYGRCGFGCWKLRMTDCADKAQEFVTVAELRQKAAEVA